LVPRENKVAVPARSVPDVIRREADSDGARLWSEAFGTGPALLTIGGIGSGTLAGTSLAPTSATRKCSAKL
jgi:hypothetical protein